MVCYRLTFDLLETRDVPSTFHPDNPVLAAEHAYFLDQASEETVGYEWKVTNASDRNGDGLVQYSELGGAATVPNPIDPTAYYLEKWFPDVALRQTITTQFPQFVSFFVTLGPLVFGPVPQPEPVPGTGGPKDGDDLWVQSGVTLVLDTDTARLDDLRVDGVLAADPTRDVTLFVHNLFNMEHGTLRFVNPVFENSFTVVFTEHIHDAARDPRNLLGGLISHGRVLIDGADVPTWGPAETIAGADISTDDGTIPPAGFTHHEANLDRNIVFRDEGTDPTASAHVMLMHNPDVRVLDAAFEGLGRTRKDIPLDDAGTNIRGRYALHIHRAMSETPVLISGAVIVDPTSWGIVNHSSNVVVENSVVAGAFGAGIVAEAGDEVGWFRNNLVLNTRHNLDTVPWHPVMVVIEREGVGDFGHRGYGFWFQSAGVNAEGNVAAGFGVAGYGFYTKPYVEPDTRAFVTPASRNGVVFRGNTALGGLHGLQAYNSVPLTVEDLDVWDVGEGAEVFGGATVDFHGGIFDGSDTGSVGINYWAGFGYPGAGSLHNVTLRGWDLGVVLPGHEDATVEGGMYQDNRRGDLYAQLDWGQRTITLAGVPASARIVLPDPLLTGGFHYTDPTHFYSVKLPRLVRDGVQLYHRFQAQDHIPFSYGPLAGLTNRQIYDAYGLLPLGFLAPEEAVLLGDHLEGPAAAPALEVLPISYPVSLTPEYSLVYHWGGERASGELSPLPFSRGGQTYVEMLILDPGWNLLTREHDGAKYTFLVYLF